MPASQIYQATETLNNAQILALPTVPIILVPPTEVLNYSGTPTQLLVPLLGIARIKVHAGDYTHVNAGVYFGIDIGSDDSFTYSARTLSAASAFINTAGGVAFFTPGTKSGGNAGVANTCLTNNLNDSLLDNAIVFFAFNQGDGNFEDGHATNSMKVTVFYTIIDV